MMMITLPHESSQGLFEPYLYGTDTDRAFFVAKIRQPLTNKQNIDTGLKRLPDEITKKPQVLTGDQRKKIPLHS